MLDAEPPQFRPEGMRGVLRAPVGADCQPPRHILADAAKGVPHALVERLERRPPIPALCDLPPDELVRRVIDRPEKPAPAIALGPEARRVRAPELVRAVSRDAAGVRRIAVDVSGTR